MMYEACFHLIKNSEFPHMFNTVDFIHFIADFDPKKLTAFF